MCKAMEDMRNEAKLEERKEIACSLLVDGELSYEKIAKHTGFTVEEIQKLATQEGA